MALTWGAGETATSFVLKDTDNSNKVLATIEGVKEAPAVPADTEITVTEAMLDTENHTTVSLKNEEGSEYTLTLSSEGITPYDATGTVGLDMTAISSNGIATIKQTPTAGWSLSSNSVTYQTGTATPLATISGLKKTATTTDVVYDSSESDTIITLNEGAFDTTQTKSTVTLTKNDDNNFTLQLGDGLRQDGVELTDVSKGTFTNGKLIIKGTFNAGYREDDSTNITYTAAKTVDIAEITGLSDNAGTEGNVTLAFTEYDGENTQVVTATLKGGENGALTTNDIAITQKTTEEDICPPDLALALKKDDGTAAADGKLGFASIAAAWASEGSNAVYREGKKEGWTLVTEGNDANKKIEYTPEASATLATISGVKSGLTVSSGSIAGITLDGTKITLAEGVLDRGNVSLTNGENLEGTASEYTLVLDAAVPQTAVLDNTTSFSFGSSTSYLMGTLKEYYTATDSAITYTAAKSEKLAQIDGALKSGVAASDFTVNVTDNTEVDAPATTPKKYAVAVTVKKSAINTSKDGAITLKALEAPSAIDAESTLTFALDGGATGLGESDPYWVASGTTATYQRDKAAGYTFAEDTEAATKTYNLNYYVASNPVIAKITGLNSSISSSSVYKAVEKESGEIKAGTGTIVGITVVAPEYEEGVVTTEGTITLDKSVLGTSASAKASFTVDSAYTLALNSSTAVADKDKVVPQEAAPNTPAWTFGTNTATYSKSTPAYWTLDSGAKTISYTAEANKRTLATVTGLKTITDDAVLAANIVINDPEDETEEADPGTITLGNGALNAKDVKITKGNYKLALTNSAEEGVAVTAPVEANHAWTVSGTTAYYKGKITTAGYTLSGDSEIKYTAASGDNLVTFATITNLKSGLKVSTAGDDTKGKVGSNTGAEGAFEEALSIATNEGIHTVTLNKNALGISKISIAGTNYYLALNDRDETIKKSTYNAEDPENPVWVPPANENVWRVSGTTATYKTVTPAYYTPNAQTNATSIAYTAEATAKVDVPAPTASEPEKTEKKDAIIATITGLKTGLKVNAEDGIDGIALEEKTVTLSKNVLTTSTTTPVKITNGNAATYGDAEIRGTYKLALDKDNAEETLIVNEPEEEDNKTWTVSGTTATYKGSISAGWTLGKQNASDAADANNQITYSARVASQTFATVKGLKSGLTAAKLNTDANPLVRVDTEEGQPPTIVLQKEALGGEDISVTGDYGYILALEPDADIRKVPRKGNVWSANGTTYTYKEVNLDYYAYDKKTGSDEDDKTKIKYTAQSDVANGTIAKFAGLKSGLKISNVYATIGVSVIIDDEPIIRGITVEGSEFVVSADALDKKEVTISDLKDGYSINASFDADNPQDGEKYWKVSDTTVTYQHDTTAGYAYDAANKKITYSAATTTTDATITGLKSGLKVENLAGEGEPAVKGIDGITEASGVITLDADKVLTTTDVTLTGEGYTLTGEYPEATAGTAWVVDKTTAHLVNYSSAFYTLNTSTNKNITYTPAKVGTKAYSSLKASQLADAEKLATLTNLKSGLKPDADGQIAGLTVDGTEITLSANVLDKKNVANTKEESTYTLALDLKPEEDPEEGHTYVATPTESGKWTVSKATGGVPTYTSTTTAGYQVDEVDDTETKKTKGQILYSPEKVIKVTINGLKPVFASADGKSVGLKGGTTANPTYYGITFTRGEENVDNYETDGVGIVKNESSGATEKLAAKLTFTKDVLDGKNVTMTISGKGEFALDLAEGVAAKTTTENPVWSKETNKNVATLIQTTEAGYSVSSDSSKIVYSTKATVETFATVTGLKKDVASLDGELAGISVTSAPTTTEEENEETGETTTVLNPGVIEISKDLLTNSNVTLGKNDKYEFALASNYSVTDAEPSWSYDKSKGTASVMIGKTEGWAYKQTKAADEDAGTEAEYDKKTIVYTKANLDAIAKVSGLNKTLTVNENGKIDGLVIGEFSTGDPAVADNAEAESTPTKVTISISNSVLNKTTAKVEVVKKYKNDYSFSFVREDDIAKPEKGENYWVTDQKKGSATYQYTITAGYTSNDEEAPTELKYSAETKPVLFTISGLKKNSSGGTAVESSDLAGVEVTKAYEPAVAADPENDIAAKDAVIGEITLTSEMTSTGANNFEKKVTLKNGTGKYTFNIDDIAVQNAEKPEWSVSGTTATLKAAQTAGYKLSSNDTVATFNTATTKNTLVTIKGLAKNLKAVDLNDEEKGLIVVEGDMITLGKDVVTTSTIKLTQGKDGENHATNYYFDASTESVKAPEVEDTFWTVSKGTATVKQTSTAGFTPKGTDADKPTELTYSKVTTVTLATVKNLNPNLAVPTAEEIAADTAEDDTKLNNDRLYVATTTVDAKGKKTYSVAAGSTYVAQFDPYSNEIVLYNNAMNKKKVTVSVPKKSAEYTLTLDESVPTYAANVTEWTVSGTTGTYRNYDQGFYTNNGKAVEYTAETKGTTYATVTGLKKDVTNDVLNAGWEAVNDDDGAQGGVLTLDSRHLGTSNVKIATTLKNTENRDAFALALDTSSANKVTESDYASLSWSRANGSGKSDLTGTLKAGYMLEFGGKSITYTKTDKANQTLATITGLKKDASISASGDTITLTEDKLDGKTVTVTTSKGKVDYKLSAPGVSQPVVADDDDSKLPLDKTSGEPISALTWSGSAMKGYVTTAGYTLSESGKTLTYTKANADTKKVKDSEGNEMNVYKNSASLATIGGLNKNETPTVEGTAISVEGQQVKDNKVSVNAGIYEVTFDSDFKNKSIAGSANVDKITVAGTGVSVTGGKGDDYVDLGSGNTFIYSSGDGNDVINNFDLSADKLQIKSGTALVEKSGNDFIVKVGSGSITLKGVAENTNELTIYNSKNVATTYVSAADAVVAGSDLLVDNNYSMDAAQLSSIVEPASIGLTPYDINSGLNLTKEDVLTAQISYAKEK